MLGEDDNQITYFGQTDARNRRINFGIRRKDRSRHTYVIGKTGMGKSTLLENMAIQDIKNGEGMAFIDPHGKSAEFLLDYVPEHRIKDVLYFAPFDMDYPVAFNVMEDVGGDKRHLVVNGLMSTFEKIWVDAWSARMAYILNNTLYALLEFPGATLLGINKMLGDKEYRKKVVENVKDPSVKSFWVDEFGKYTDKYAAEATPAIQNKVGQFTSNPLIRNIIGQPRSTFNLREIMDKKKILIINLSKGRVGEGNANLLGSMLITKIYLAAMSRADASESALSRLPNFYLYVDEFQSFANKSFADILSEARKYKLNLTIAHQYIEQMEEEVRAAVFGNVGTMITFRVGAFDAEVLEKEFAPEFTAEDLVNLGVYQIYLKLMIDGVSSSPFSATTMPPIEKPLISFKPAIVKASREQFARPRTEVEEEIVTHQLSAGAAARAGALSGEHLGGGAEATTQKSGVFFPPPPMKARPVDSGERRPFRGERPERPAHTPEFRRDGERREERREDRRENPIPSRRFESRPPNPAPIRLDSLKRQDFGAKPNPKQQGNLSELRKALSAVLAENKDKVPEMVKREPEPSRPTPRPETRPETKTEAHSHPPNDSRTQSARPKEIPEDVLKKIMEVPEQ